MHAFNARRISPPPCHEQGVVLFVALIALVAMTLAAIGLVRSHTTGAMIAGNMAFKQNTLQAADTAIDLAIQAMGAFLPVSQENDIPDQYFATMQPVNAQGVPNTIDWANVPCRDTAGNAIACNAVAAGQNRMQYVVDRLCNGPTPVANVDGQCVTDRSTGGGSHKAGSTVFAGTGMVYYRITARVQGARDTVTLAQAIVGVRR